jgi:hypothetical protein
MAQDIQISYKVEAPSIKQISMQSSDQKRFKKPQLLQTEQLKPKPKIHIHQVIPSLLCQQFHTLACTYVLCGKRDTCLV